MNLKCNTDVAAHLKSRSQMARVISEDWLAREGYCLNCTSNRLEPTRAGTVACDYLCPGCRQPYELKAAAKMHSGIVPDGGYESMLRRIRNADAPSLMLLNYTQDWWVRGLVAIHPVFLTPAVVLRRAKPHIRPKSNAPYQMCDLNLRLIPADGKIVLVADGKEVAKSRSRELFRQSCRFAEVPMADRGWAALVLAVVRRLGKAEFTYTDLYRFEEELHAAYPQNNHIRPKIRQQMQRLRDLGYVEFVAPGEFRVLR